jgi:hypothetical protein
MIEHGVSGFLGQTNDQIAALATELRMMKRGDWKSPLRLARTWGGSPSRRRFGGVGKAYWIN